MCANVLVCGRPAAAAVCNIGKAGQRLSLPPCPPILPHHFLPPAAPRYAAEWWRVNKQTVLAQVRGRPAPGLRSLGRPASRRRAQARSHGLGLKIGHQLLLLQHADDHGTQPPPHPLIPLVLSPFDLAVMVPCSGPGRREFWAGYGDVGWRAGDLPPWGLRPRRTGQGQGQAR